MDKLLNAATEAYVMRQTEQLFPHRLLPLFTPLPMPGVLPATAEELAAWGVKTTAVTVPLRWGDGVSGEGL